MKIKEICGKTGLTDRTIRYYIEEQLITPFYTENYLGRRSFDFSEQDLEKLKSISTLRAFGFSIEELKALSVENDDYKQIVEAVKNRAEESFDESKRRLNRLSGLELSGKISLSELAQKLSAPDVEIQNESTIPHKKKSFISFLVSCAIFLAVWLPIILSISVLMFKIATTQMPIVRPIFLFYIFLCFLPSTITVIIPQKIKGAKKNFRMIFILLCVLCIPLGMFLSLKCITACNHSYETYKVIVDATCQSEGEIIVKCDECGGFGSKSVEKLPHIGIVIKGVEPTCSAGGISDGYKCTLCNAVLINQKKIPPTELHTPSIDAAIAPTCTKTGHTEGSHCSVCDTVLVGQTVIPVIDHSPVAIAAIAPTCKDTGLTEGSFCSVCNQVLIEQIIVPTTQEHVAVIDAAISATCKDTGLGEGSHCSVCDQVLVEQEVVPTTQEHVAVVDAAIQPTCKNKGWTEGSHCSVCGETLLARETILATGHSYTSKKVEPTCSDIGYTLYKCICGESYKTDNIRETNEHDFQINDVGHTCRVCGFEAIAQGNAGKTEDGENNSVKYYIFRSDSFQNCVTLVIYGSGDIPDYDLDNPPPWDGYAERIRTIIIESKITSVGNYAFCNPLYAVYLRECIIRSQLLQFDNNYSDLGGIDTVMCEIILDY